MSTMNPFSNPYLLGSLLLATLAQVAVIHVGFLRMVFRTVPLTLAQWAEIILVSSTVVVVVEMDKLLRRNPGS